MLPRIKKLFQSALDKVPDDTKSTLVLHLLLLVFFTWGCVSSVWHFHDRYITETVLAEMKEDNELCTGSKYQFCQIPSQFKFEKFVWLAVDAFPEEYAKEFLAVYGDGALMFKINDVGMPYSISSWSQIAGHLPSKVPTQDTGLDSIFASIHRRYKDTGQSVRFISGAPYVQFLRQAELGDVFHDLDPSSSWSTITTNFLVLQQSLVQNRSSLFYHSSILSDILSLPPLPTKQAPRGTMPDAALKLLKNANKDLISLKRFIDLNTDYVLVITTSGLGEYWTATKPKDGAEGFLFIYDARRGYASPPTTQPPIDPVDVAATLSLLFGADIPSNNIGVAQNIYDLDGGSYLKALKQNVVQLSNVASSRGVTGAHERLPDIYGEKGLTPTEQAEALTALIDVAQDLKEQLGENFGFPWMPLFIHFLVMVVGMGVSTLKLQYNPIYLLNTKEYALHWLNNVVFTLLVSVVTIFSFVMFSFSWWKEVFLLGGYFRVFPTILALGTLFLIDNFLCVVNPTECLEETKNTTHKQYLLSIKLSLLKCEITSALAALVVWSFGGPFQELINEWPLLRETSFILSGVMLFNFFKTKPCTVNSCIGDNFIYISAASLMLVCSKLFELTVARPQYYFGGVHITAFIIYAMMFLSIFLLIFGKQGQILHLTLLLNGLLLFSWSTSEMMKLAILLYNFQYFIYLLPMLSNLKRQFEYGTTRKLLSPKSLSPLHDKFTKHTAHIILYCGLLYTILHTFFWCTQIMQTTLDFDIRVHPINFGFWGYKRVPFWVAFLPFVRKYGIFLVYAGYMMHATHLKSPENEGGVDVPDYGHTTTAASLWKALILFGYCASVIGFRLVTYLHDVGHMEALACVILFGVMGGFFSLLEIMETIRAAVWTNIGWRIGQRRHKKIAKEEIHSDV